MVVLLETKCINLSQIYLALYNFWNELGMLFTKQCKTMTNLSPLEQRKFEDLFNMPSGYVMSLSNSEFDSYFKHFGIDIFSSNYDNASGSKANRLRAFWNKESALLVGKVLQEFLKIWKYENNNTAQTNENYKACVEIADRLLGNQELDICLTADHFLEKDFGAIAFDKLPIENNMIPIIKSRYHESLQCLNNKSPLAVIFLCGSTLEGILLGAAMKNSAEFTSSPSAPKRNGIVTNITTWTLAELINVACDIKILGKDIKEFSHALRDFRNYIHPNQQLLSQFTPDNHTARICIQVLRAAIANLSKER